MACFIVTIDYYIFRPASAKKVPIVWRGKSYYQHTTNVVQLRQQSEKTQNLSSFHEKNNGYLGLSKRSFMPQLWEEVRPHFDTYAPAWADSRLAMRLVSPFLASSPFSGVVAEASMMSVLCILNIEYQ